MYEYVSSMSEVAVAPIGAAQFRVANTPRDGDNPLHWPHAVRQAYRFAKGMKGCELSDDCPVLQAKWLMWMTRAMWLIIGNFRESALGLAPTHTKAIAETYVVIKRCEALIEEKGCTKPPRPMRPKCVPISATRPKGSPMPNPAQALPFLPLLRAILKAIRSRLNPSPEAPVPEAPVPELPPEVPSLPPYAPIPMPAGGGCFVAGTLIHKPAGPRPIESLSLGDEVLSYNTASAGVVRARVISVIRARHNDIVELPGEGIRCSGNHRF